MKVQKQTWLTLVIQFRLYDFWVTVGLEGVTDSVTLFDWVTFWTIWYDLDGCGTNVLECYCVTHYCHVQPY